MGIGKRTAPHTLFFLGCLAGLASCRGETSRPAPAASSSAALGEVSEARGLELRPAPGELPELTAFVRAETERSQAAGRRLLVYVGASWCEPCRRFHDAAAAGALDALLPPLTILEFDHDRDEAPLRAAGYTSRLIPLFAVPGPDGRASGKQMEGSIKGDGAVGDLVPRLRTLLGG